MKPKNLSKDCFLLEGKNDNNKKVIINSISGLLKNEPGTVIYGPYKNNYEQKIELKTIHKISKTNWYIHIPRLNKSLHFTEQEIKFIK